MRKSDCPGAPGVALETSIIGPYRVTTLLCRAGGPDAWRMSFCGTLAGVFLAISTAAAQTGVTVKPVASRVPRTFGAARTGPDTSASYRRGGLGGPLDDIIRPLGLAQPRFDVRPSYRRRGNPGLTPLRSIGGQTGYAPLFGGERLLQENSLAGVLRRLSEGIAGTTLHQLPAPIEFEGVLQEVDGAAAGEGQEFSDLLAQRIAAYHRERIAAGWVYLQSGDYLRSMAAFESLESVDRRSTLPRFGQLLSAVANGHYRRAINKLARILKYDESRGPAVPGMFEYDVSLQTLMGTEGDLNSFLQPLRFFAERHPGSDGPQALYCYLLWYLRSENTAIEAAGIAEQIKNADPYSRWARFGPMIREAQRQLRETDGPERQPEANASDAASETPPAG